VGFNQAATLELGLTTNRTAVEQALESLAAGGGTDIAAGVDLARRELTTAGRPHATAVILLLTDGGNNAGPAPALRAADQAKLDGARLIGVAYGDGADRALLEQMASSPADAYFAPSAAELERIYREIASRLAADVLFTNLVISDEIPSNMAYVPGSSEPPAEVAGQTLTWQLSDVPLSGITLRYRVRPLETGRWPTNVVAVGRGTDGLGQRGGVSFPVPEVVVRAPSPTPSHTETAEPTARPGRVYLPLLRSDVCVERRQHVDVVMVVDTSDSMLATTRAGRSKLEAAVDAAGQFVEMLDLTGDAAAVVWFNSAAAVRQPLTRDAHALRDALATIPQAPGTRIDLGLAQARDALLGPGRHADNLGVAVVLTDGIPSGTTRAAVVTAADELRAAAGVVYAIGLGHDIDAALLTEIAGDERRRLLAPDAEDLARIYAEIAVELPCLDADGSTWMPPRGGRR
jgi:Mg-chelatase subunit ChlD